MSNPMTVEDARAMAASLDEDCFSGPEEYEIAATLRAYADTLDRQTVDREAVRKLIKEHSEIVSWGPADEALDGATTDAILALMPAAPVVARELEWCETKAPAWLKKKKPNLPRNSIAYTPFGDYDVCYDKGDADWFFTAPSGKQFDGFKTLEAAKDAAQAHYNDAIAKAVKGGE